MDELFKGHETWMRSQHKMGADGDDSERLRLQEEPAEQALVEDRIALVATNRRILAFTGAAGWIEESFGPNETPTALRAGSAAGAAWMLP